MDRDDTSGYAVRPRGCWHLSGICRTYDLPVSTLRAILTTSVQALLMAAYQGNTPPEIQSLSVDSEIHQAFVA